MGLMPPRRPEAASPTGTAASSFWAVPFPAPIPVPILVLALALLLGACARPATGPPMTRTEAPLPRPGQLILEPGRVLSAQDFVRQAANAAYVLIGESHTSPCDHQVQAGLLSALATGPRPPALGLEMVAEDQEAVLEDFNAGRIPLDQLEERLNWKENWGHAFDQYRPLFALARAHGLPVSGLNLPFAVVRRATREGMEALTPEERAHFPAVVIPPPREQETMLLEVLSQHKGNATAPDSGRMERFFRTQAAWDTNMAERTADLRRRTGRPVVVVAGSGHVDHGWGIAHRLAVLDPGAEALLVSPWRGNEPWDQKAGDLFFYCPPTHKSRLGMTFEDQAGRIVITAVEPGSRAEKAGARAGDQVLGAAGEPVRTLGDLHQAGSRAFKAKAPLTLEVRREGGGATLDLGPLGQGQ